MATPEVQFFVDQYNQTITEAIGLEKFGRLYDRLHAIPFHIDPADLEDDFQGGLWVPPMQIQDQIGPIEHWRGYDAFKSVVSRFTEIFDHNGYVRFSPFRGDLEVTSEDPCAVELVVHDAPFLTEAIKSQVEADFGVAISAKA